MKADNKIMIFEQLKVGHDNFAYLIADERSDEAALIDPAFEPKKILRSIKMDHRQNLCG